MKKFFAILLAVTMLASMATVVSAESTTTLTTTVPAASYTLNIPADQEIVFGATATDIGVVTVTNSNGFAWGKHLKVTLSWEDFKSEGVASTIPFSIKTNYTDGDHDLLCGCRAADPGHRSVQPGRRYGHDPHGHPCGRGPVPSEEVVPLAGGLLRAGHADHRGGAGT